MLEMGRIRDKGKMRKKRGGEQKRGSHHRTRRMCAKHMQEEEGKAKEGENITTGEIYREISGEYR